MANPKKIVPVVAGEKANIDRILKQRMLIGFEVLDLWGSVRKTGSVQILTVAHCSTDPTLLHEVMKATGLAKNPDFTTNPRKAWLEIISISPIRCEILTSTADPRYQEFAQNQGK